MERSGALAPLQTKEFWARGLAKLIAPSASNGGAAGAVGAIPREWGFEHRAEHYASPGCRERQALPLVTREVGGTAVEMHRREVMRKEDGVRLAASESRPQRSVSRRET